ncbi:hydroxymethylbilane synthase [Actinospica sp. MGRD01-02]|uniref:Porphobilinogen deaminase n=1 Tax=Actinospica acidithermotolerans TaxID=2828514 RepID=A0A941II70_9ACTN|nr:hydroxymethylbilane synthase [Actinospica acidithermotolerans]MBR7825853.1 hydroxymethylbilane synthase [Actinospica acidithermotolerans]
MTRTLRLGTRRSKLAMTQSGMVAAALTAATGHAVELVEITTYGDTSQATNELLSQIGGTGVFVNALREALLRGEVDFVVHSLKDLPTAAAEGLSLAAVPEREDVRDVLVARDGRKLADLPAGARIGTGSNRRAAQLRIARPDLEVVPVRGNVDTRVGFVESGKLDAVVLAYAGLNRLGRIAEATDLLDPADFLPCPGQGALGVECRADDAEMSGLLAPLDHAPTRAAVVAERALLATLEAGCSAPVGGYALPRHDDERELIVTGIVASADPNPTGAPASVRGSLTGPVEQAARLGAELADRLLAQGAAALMTQQLGEAQ